jgi:mono/diheme cytochrome c family protein
MRTLLSGLFLFAALALPLRLAAQAQTPADAAALYKSKCAPCHLADGNAKTPSMNFADGNWQHGSSLQQVADVIRNGVKGTAMLPFKSKLTDDQIVALAKHVRAFDKTLKD